MSGTRRAYVVLGAGAVGGVIGGHLHRAGHPTTLVARGSHLSALRDNGLVLDTGAGREVVETATAGSSSEVDWIADTVVVLAVKSHQAEAALVDLALHAPPSVTVVCATNGIAVEAMALRRFADVLAIGVMLPATHLEPGVVVASCHPTPGILDVGRVPGGPGGSLDPGVEAISDDLRSAGFESRPEVDIMAAKRRKLVRNVGNGVDAAYRPGAAADALEERAIAEAEAALAATGLSLVSAADDDVRRGDLLRRRPDLARTGGSTWQSVHRSTGDSEIDYLAGEIVLLGRLHGVATPACEAIQAATRTLAATGGAARSLPVPDLD